MKSTNDRVSHLSATIAIPHQLGRPRVSNDLKERLETDVVLSAGFAAILALSVVMFVWLYNWGRYAPLFLHQGTGVPAIEQTIPWQG
jgi:hypothetical protein